MSKIVDMDHKPAFLETGDLERLSKNPEVRENMADDMEFV